MKKILFAFLAITFSSIGFAQQEVPAPKGHQFPRKLTDLSSKTKTIELKDSVLTDTLLLLNDMSGPVILRVCVTKQSPKDMSHLSVSLSDGTFILEEYLNDRRVSKQDDFVLCKDNQFRSIESLNGKSVRVTSYSGVGRSLYVEAYPKNNPSLSWPVLVKNKYETSYDASYINIEMHNPNK